MYFFLETIKNWVHIHSRLTRRRNPAAALVLPQLQLPPSPALQGTVWHQNMEDLADIHHVSLFGNILSSSMVYIFWESNICCCLMLSILCFTCSCLYVSMSCSLGIGELAYRKSTFLWMDGTHGFLDDQNMCVCACVLSCSIHSQNDF